VASLIYYGALLVRLRLYHSSRLSLSAYIHFFIKLALLATYVIMISLPVCGLSYVSLTLYM
jgi:hypothetical protein